MGLAEEIITIKAKVEDLAKGQGQTQALVNKTRIFLDVITHTESDPVSQFSKVLFEPKDWVWDDDVCGVWDTNKWAGFQMEETITMEVNP